MEINKEQLAELKQLILDEIKLRKEFVDKSDELEELVKPINKHIEKCFLWWDKNLPRVEEIVVIMDNGTTLKIIKPKDDTCFVKTNLPFGIDYSECEVIEII